MHGPDRINGAAPRNPDPRQAADSSFDVLIIGSLALPAAAWLVGVLPAVLIWGSLLSLLLIASRRQALMAVRERRLASALARALRDGALVSQAGWSARTVGAKHENRLRIDA